MPLSDLQALWEFSPRAESPLNHPLKYQRLKPRYPLKHWIICNQSRSPPTHGRRCLYRIRSSEPVACPNLRRQIRDLHHRRNPFEIRIGREQSIELIHAVVITLAVGLHQQFRHRDSGRDRCGARPLQPGEDVVGESEIPSVGFELIDESAGIDRDPAVTPEKGTDKI